MHGFGPGKSSSSFALSEGEDMGLDGPAAGELAKAEGTGQVGCLCLSEGLR